MYKTKLAGKKGVIGSKGCLEIKRSIAFLSIADGDIVLHNSKYRSDQRCKVCYHR